MGIPKSILRKHVLEAMHQLSLSGVPNGAESTKYDVVTPEGRLLPPKLVLSRAAEVATGVPLSREDFSGGEQTNNRLRELGFEIRLKASEFNADFEDQSLMPRPAGRAYWAFQCNPSKYDIWRALAELDNDVWRVGRSDVQVGDRLLIWKSFGYKKTRGIIALGEVIGEKRIIPDYSPHFRLGNFDVDHEAQRVDLRYVRSPKLPIWVGGAHDDLLLSLTVSRARGLVFHVSQDQWQGLMRVIGGWPSSSPEVEDAREEISAIASGAPRQGFRSSPEERKAVEDRAMRLATEHYTSNGWSVEDTSKRECYDLLCRRDGVELRVEVKGTTGFGSEVLLTANEVDNARERYPQVALALVSGITLSKSSVGVQATGGTLKVHDPWKIDLGHLLPICFSYRCPNLIGSEEK